jgi:predicted Zn-dependent peptidase
MLNFMAERYVGNNLCVVAAGGLDHEELVRLVNLALGDVPCSGPDLPIVAPVVKRNVEVVNRVLEQTHICLGVAGLPQNHVDRYGVYLLNIILGGNMSSRLFQKVREDLGMAYSVYSYHHNHSDSGAFIIYAGTSPGDAPLVVRTILKELTRLRCEAVSVDELQSAKDYLKGSMLLSMESMDNRMTRLAKNELFLRDVGICLEESRAMIDAVTIDLVQHMAESLFVNETLNLLVCGQVKCTEFPDIDLQFG